MTPEQRAQAVAERRGRKLPWHGPPHFEAEEGTYVLSAACFEHRELISPVSRLDEFSETLLDGLEKLRSKVHAWVVMPNHYHVLAEVDLIQYRRRIARLHNGKSTQWNREDGAVGRKVWHRFSDRRVRNERHFYASLNYLHANPVKHGYAKKADEWPWSSLHGCLDSLGREKLVELWREYPVLEYGRGWDD
jgi:putative transposase